MSDISFSPGGPQMPRNDIQPRKSVGGLAAFHTFDEQKEETSSRSKFIAGVAVAVMFAAVAGYSYVASQPGAPARPVASTSTPAPQSVATTPPAPTAAPVTNNAAPAPANDVAAPVVTSPAAIVTPRAERMPAHARMVHSAPARGSVNDNAMQDRMSHASDNAPANITPPAQPALTPDTIAPAPAPTTTAPAPTNASPSTPAPTSVSPSTPAPAQPSTSAPSTPSSNTQTPAPSDPSTD